MEFIKNFMSYNSETKIISKCNPKVIFGLLSLLVFSFLTSLFLFQLASILIFVLFLFEPLSEKRKIFKFPVVKVFSLYVIVRIITIIFSEHFSDSIIALQKESIFYFASIPILFYIRSLDTKYLNKFLLVFIASGFITGIIGLIRFNLNYTHRASSIVSGYSTYSLFLLAILPLLFLIRNKSRKISYNVIWSIVLGVFISGIITSLGRMNILLMVLISLPLIFLLKVNWPKIIFTIIFTSVICIISFNNNTKELNNRINQPTTLSDRDIIYKGFFEIYNEHPVLGFGPKTFKTIFPFYDQFADQGIGGWHSDYIQVYIESGVVGLIIYLLFIITIFNQIFKLEGRKRYIFIAIFAALFISALTDGFITSTIYSIVFMSILGLAISANKIEEL